MGEGHGHVHDHGHEHGIHGGHGHAHEEAISSYAASELVKQKVRTAFEEAVVKNFPFHERSHLRLLIADCGPGFELEEFAKLNFAAEGSEPRKAFREKAQHQTG